MLLDYCSSFITAAFNTLIFTISIPLHHYNCCLAGFCGYDAATTPRINIYLRHCEVITEYDKNMSRSHSILVLTVLQLLLIIHNAVLLSWLLLLKVDRATVALSLSLNCSFPFRHTVLSCNTESNSTHLTAVLFFITGSNQTMRYCLPSHRLSEKLSGRCENTKSCCFFTPPPRFASNSLATEPLVDEWGVFAVMSKCAALKHGACEEKWQDAALSPHLSRHGQMLWACISASATAKRRRPII